jgi:hypothetical protein
MHSDIKNTLVIAALASTGMVALAHCSRQSGAAETSVGAPATPSSVATDHAALVERGRHLVESVGMCTDCHAPRLPSGEFDKTRYLMGSELPFKPTIPMPWVPTAPPLAGLPTLPTDEVAVEFMMTGKRPSGAPVLPPMPQIRLKRDEAEAVVAYLRSLKPAV